jgi:hypothetical protein
MKKLLICFILIPGVLGAQGVPAPDVKKLVVTSSPAYILLGVQPENIQRPSTPRDFTGGIQSAIVNQQLAPNFSLETNPFNWNRKTKSNQFYANDYFYNGAAAIKKNLALSLATSSSDTVVFGNLQKGIGLAYGLRVTLVPGRNNKDVAQRFLEWERAEIESIFFNIVSSQMLVGKTSFTPAEMDGYIKQISDFIDAGIVEGIYILPDNKEQLIQSVRTLAVSYAGLTGTSLSERNKADRAGVMARKNAALRGINSIKAPFAREGFLLELAGAGVTVFQGNKWEASHMGKIGVWLTPSYRFSIGKPGSDEVLQSLDILGVARYIWNDKKVDSAQYFDFGAKVQYNRAAWNGSFELVARQASAVPDTVTSRWTNSWLISFSYTVNEMTTLKFSFGSNFDGNTRKYTKPKDMFVAGGLNIGIFGK